MAILAVLDVEGANSDHSNENCDLSWDYFSMVYNLYGSREFKRQEAPSHGFRGLHYVATLIDLYIN